MKLKIDNREKKLIKLLTAMKEQFNLQNIELTVEVLDIGDFIICDDNDIEKLIVERKSLNDLASSIKDGRYIEQSLRLSNLSLHNHNIIYLVEGNLSTWTNKYKVQANTLHSAIFSLNYYKGFSVHKTNDMTETAEYLLRVCDKLNRSQKKVPYYHDGEINDNKKIPDNYVSVIKKVKKDNITPENISEIILSQIPGISAKTSQVIINQFGSLYQLLSALNDDPKCMDNISFTTEKGTRRKISKTAIRNISQYLLYQKSNIIKIDTN